MSTPVTWPSQLQDFWNEANFGLDAGDTTLRTQMDAGQAKVRRKYTKAIDSFSGSINVTAAQYAVFKTFFNTSLNGGVNTFYFDHPIEETQSVFRFVGSYKLSSLGGGQFLISFVWEEMP
jgi:hypothetical protein